MDTRIKTMVEKVQEVLSSAGVREKQMTEEKSDFRKDIEEVIDEKVIPEFKRVNQRFDQVDQRFNQIDGNLKSIINSLQALKPKP